MLSRFTDPGERAPMLDALPGDPLAICEVARAQTVHHNLLPALGVPRETWPSLARVWPPRLEATLAALAERAPHALSPDRPVENRVLGACVLESHLLAGLLRHRGFEVRIRAGYFANVREDREHVVDFWLDVMREKRAQAELLARDPQRWTSVMRAYTERKCELDHRIEHWLCEIRSGDGWTLLDANDTFLRASSGLDVGFELPQRHFEHAHEAWRALREDGVDADRYAEEPHDGRSHARTQLLFDFFSLLNHDVAAIDEPDSADHAFVKGRSYADVGAEEMAALDALAALLASDPPPDALVAFYRATPALRLGSAERDRYSLVSG